MNALQELESIKRELETLSKLKIRVGIQATENSEVLKIAGIHEYGGEIAVTSKMRGHFWFKKGIRLKPSTKFIHMPERSYIRASYDANVGELRNIVKAAVTSVVEGKSTAKQEAEGIGIMAVDMVQNFINDGKVEPKTKKSRLYDKKKPTTLYETGTHIRDRITFVVEEN
jgi:hypothetical protein